MSKKTSTIITLTIATILTAYISVFSFSNPVYAQHIGGSFLNKLPVINSLTDAGNSRLFVTNANSNTVFVIGELLGQSGEPIQHLKPGDLSGDLLAGLKAQLEVLGGNSLGDVCLSCWEG